MLWIQKKICGRICFDFWVWPMYSTSPGLIDNPLPYHHLVNLLQQPSRIQSEFELLFYDLCSRLIFPTYIRCTHDACKYNTWDKSIRFPDVYLIPCQIICTEGVFITEIYVLNNTRVPAPFSFTSLQVSHLVGDLKHFQHFRLIQFEF